MKKKPQQLNRKQNKWQVVEGIVDTSRDYIKVIYDDYSVPYALLGLSRYRTVIVQYFCGEKSWQKVVQRALARIKGEIGYYLFEKSEIDPWKYLIELATKDAEPNNQIRWQWYPSGNPNPANNQEDHQWDTGEVPEGRSKDKDEVANYTALSQYRKARVHLDINEFEEALSAFNRAIEIEADHSDWFVYRGITLRQLDKMNLAIQDFSSAIEIDPSYDFAYSSRAFCFYLMNRYEEALIDCSKAIELAPDDNSYYSNRGCVYTEKGDLENALNDYNKAIELVPHDAVCYESRANVYLRMGKLDEAKESLEEVLKIDPNDIQAFATKAQIQQGFQSNSQSV